MKKLFNILSVLALTPCVASNIHAQENLDMLGKDPVQETNDATGPAANTTGQDAAADTQTPGADADLANSVKNAEMTTAGSDYGDAATFNAETENHAVLGADSAEKEHAAEVKKEKSKAKHHSRSKSKKKHHGKKHHHGHCQKIKQEARPDIEHALRARAAAMQLEGQQQGGAQYDAPVMENQGVHTEQVTKGGCTKGSCAAA